MKRHQRKGNKQQREQAVLIPLLAFADRVVRKHQLVLTVLPEITAPSEIPTRLFSLLWANLALNLTHYTWYYALLLNHCLIYFIFCKMFGMMLKLFSQTPVLFLSSSAGQAAPWACSGSQIEGSVGMFFPVCKAGKSQPGILTSLLLSHCKIPQTIFKNPWWELQEFVNALL